MKVLLGFISVFILLSVNLTCFGNNYGLNINSFWSSIKNTLLRKTYGQKSTEDYTKTINQYWLFTRDNPLKGHQVIMKDTTTILYMRDTKNTICVIHGWLGDYEDDLNVNITAALLHNDDVNVICVDWSAYSKALYTSSVNSVPKVGTDVGDFIKWLVSLGFSYDKIHIVGHSLGAHIAGYAGRRVNGKIKRITGLDPAGPGWDTHKMLNLNDAQYVEGIHTCAKLFGTDELCGHADFFPNGGVIMPGCGLHPGCSHNRAFYYFAASTVFPDKFIGSKCKSVEDAMDCKCNGQTAVMGNNDLDKKVTGIYCLKTNEDYPYI